MSKKLIHLCIMTVVLGGLIAWYFAYEKNLRVTHEEKDEGEKRFTSFKKEDIQEITLEVPQKPAVKVKRAGEQWNLVAPMEDSADTSAVNSLINTLTTTKYEDVVDKKPEKIDVFGLDKPTLTVTLFKDANTPVEKVTFGADTPIGGAVYYQTAKGPEVYRVSTFTKTSLVKSPEDLRDKAIVKLARADINEVEVQNTKGSILLSKGEKDIWFLPREGLRTDFGESNKFLNALLDGKAIAHIDDTNLAKYGLSAPKIKIWLTKSADKSRTALIAARAGEKCYLKRDDKKVIFEIGKDLYDKLDASGTTLRSMDVASFDRFNLQRIKWERKEAPLELQRADNQWQVTGSPSVKIDGVKVDSWMTVLQDMKLTKYENKGKVASPRLTLRLMEKKEKATGETEAVVLKFGAAKGGQVLVERSGLDLLFTIKEGDFAKLDEKQAHFVKVEKPAEPPKEAPGAPAIPGLPPKTEAIPAPQKSS